MREGPVSDHSFTAEMRALPAITARWAAIGRQNRRACGYATDNAASGFYLVSKPFHARLTALDEQ